MSRAKPELLKKLAKYSKEDIIEAIGKQYQADFIISGIINDLEHRASQKVLDDHGKALDALIAAREAFSKWRNEMCARYGDGKSVKLADIPPEEISKGATLEKALKEATETEQRLDKKVNRMLKI